MTSPHLWLPYSQMQTLPPSLAVERTDGVRLHLADGRSLIDGISSWWTACHGYNHSHIRAAVAAQLERMPHVMLGGLVHTPAVSLAARLAALLPGDLNHAFFSESGSVAVEIAMKMALQYRFNRGESQRTRFLSFRHGYHGDTFAAMSVCDPEEGMHQLFGDVLPKQLVVSVPSTPELRAEFERTVAAHAHELTAVVLEPLVQAAGGMKFHSAETLAFIAATARRFDVLLILDEIATGFGRTGTMFACEHENVSPDLMAIAKGMTGGYLPLAATLATEEIFSAFLAPTQASRQLFHGHSYSGNALGCAAALANLEIFETEDVLGRVARTGARLATRLEELRARACVGDIRQRGLIAGIELVRDRATREPFDPRDRVGHLVCSAMRKHGILLRPLGDTVVVMPPLSVSEAEIDAIVDALSACLREVTGA